ncbi:MAG: cation:proton antiporter [Bacteroidales bacterium]|jgi:Kef-type K+ transport system membrane component KefB|nr:cation:proton antiporter [Bacteroidales bacterium]NLM93094.1 cation:proton antiporter [Bacteroidales bacterium]
MELFNDTFLEFAAMLALAVGAGLIGRFLRQPLIVSFIAVGLLVGPYGLSLLQSDDQVHLLSEMGIAVLLFVVGLKLDVSLIRSTGKVALYAGLGQVLFTSVFGFLLNRWMGFDMVVSIYVAVALTFSSTIIIVKLLSDKKEIDTLHGQISIGFLIVQDIVVIIAMIALSAMGTPSEYPLWQEIAIVVLKGIGLIVLIILLMRFVLGWLTSMLARTPELLVLFSLTWAITLAGFSDFLGFSKEVGAFLGGISLASTPYREVIAGRLTSVRDFLLLFFFISLGSQVNVPLLGEQIFPAVVLSLFVLIGNPIIVMVILGLMGYRKRTGFLAGLNVAQISEFSLILAALGLSLGQINEETLGLITLVGLITIGISTYLIMYSHQIYEKVSFLLDVFEKKVPTTELGDENLAHRPFDIIIFGLGLYGNSIAKSLEKAGFKVFGVDFDPKAVKRWKKKGRAAQYGDADDPELHEILPLSAQCIISTITDKQINFALIKYLKLGDFKGHIAMTSYTGRTAKELEKAGADLILLPFADAAEGIPEKLKSLKKKEE